MGDDDSNPYPSFVGSNINDIFFYRNRLGFISE
nr:MAG TPA: stabilization protein [Caudoviricetes sp.]